MDGPMCAITVGESGGSAQTSPPNESRRKSFLSQSTVTSTGVVPSLLHLAGYFFLFILTCLFGKKYTVSSELL